MAPVLTARLLGQFVVEIDGRPLAPSSWRHGSAKRLLKLLLVTPRHRLRREVAAETLWPDLPDGRAAMNLRRAVHFLGRVLESSGTCLLMRDQRALGFAPSIHLDTDLDRASAAIERLDRLLLGGRPDPPDTVTDVAALVDGFLDLPGWDLLPDDPYEEWLAPSRDQLSLRLVGSLLAAARSLAAAGFTGTAAMVAARLVDFDPADEDAHRLAIELYARDGRANAARRHQRLLERLTAQPETFELALRR